MCAQVYHTLKKLLKEDGYSTGVGDEGGFAPDLKNSEEVLGYLVKAMEKNGLKPGSDMKIAIDAASSELYDEASGMYLFPGESRMAGKEIRRSAQAVSYTHLRLVPEVQRPFYFPLSSAVRQLQGAAEYAEYRGSHSRCFE